MYRDSASGQGTSWYNLVSIVASVEPKERGQSVGLKENIKPPGVGDAAPLYLSPGPVFLQTTGVLPGSGLPVTP